MSVFTDGNDHFSEEDQFHESTQTSKDRESLATIEEQLNQQDRSYKEAVTSGSPNVQFGPYNKVQYFQTDTNLLDGDEEEHSDTAESYKSESDQSQALNAEKSTSENERKEGSSTDDPVQMEEETLDDSRSQREPDEEILSSSSSGSNSSSSSSNSSSSKGSNSSVEASQSNSSSQASGVSKDSQEPSQSSRESDSDLSFEESPKKKKPPAPIQTQESNKGSDNFDRSKAHGTRLSPRRKTNITQKILGKVTHSSSGNLKVPRQVIADSSKAIGGKPDADHE